MFARVLGQQEDDMAIKSIRWNIKTDDLPQNQRYCTCCEKPLSAAARMLELDQRTQTYHDFQDVPAELSQGWFPFGLTCARNRVADAWALRKESAT